MPGVQANGVVLPPEQPTAAEHEHLFIPPTSEEDWRQGHGQDDRRGPSLTRYVVAGTAAFVAAMAVVTLAASASSGPFDMNVVDRSAPGTPQLAAVNKAVHLAQPTKLAIKTAADLKSAAQSARHSPTATSSSLAQVSKQMAAGGADKAAKASILKEKTDDSKIKVRLYMESQCPMCKKLSTTYIKQMLATQEMRDVVDFRFVPWGNGAIMDGATKAVLNTTAQLEPVLQQYTELEKETQGGGGMADMLSNLEHGIAAAWGGLEKEFSALKQMDAINPKYLKPAHPPQPVSAKAHAAQHMAASAAKRNVKLAAQQPASVAHKSTAGPSPLEKLEKLPHQAPAAASSGRQDKAKLASWLAQHTKADKAASARIAKLSGLRKEVAEIDLEAQELKQLPQVQALQAANGTNTSDAADAAVESFESWWAAQPKFDMEAWLASKSTKNASDPRSEMQIWLDDQPSFDLEAWLDAQPNFDLNSYLNPPPAAPSNASNTSLAQVGGESWSVAMKKYSIFTRTLKTVDKLKKMMHSMLAIRNAASLREQRLAAQPLPNILFACQHGGTECAGNAWESCVQDLYPESTLFLPVIDCIEGMTCSEGEKPPMPGSYEQASCQLDDCKSGGCLGAPADVAPGCVAKHGTAMNPLKLHECVYGKAGSGPQVPRSTVLLIKNALATIEQTGRQWVPWLTIEGEPVSKTDDDFNQMFLVGTKVCDAYKAKTGKEPPAACSTFIKEAPEQGHWFDPLKDTPFAAPAPPPPPRAAADDDKKGKEGAAA